MEVVDAEYQWYGLDTRGICPLILKSHCRDRRKLTFYFVAEKRIDFRELVRELFRYVGIALFCQYLLILCAVVYTRHVSGWPRLGARAGSNSDRSTRPILSLLLYLVSTSPLKTSCTLSPELT